MIVIAIIIIFFGITAGFEWKPRSNAEKADLLSVGISGRIRESIQNITIGRMPNRDGTLAQKAIVTIGTGGMKTDYMSGATVISTDTFMNPFFEGDKKYTIDYVNWTGSVTPAHWVGDGTGMMIIDPLGISFSGGALYPNLNNNTYLIIRIKYGDSTRKIYLDRRTGKITEKKF